MKLAHLVAGLVFVTLAGCAIFNVVRTPPRTDVVYALVELTDDLPERVYGRAYTKDGVCYVQVRKKTYPYCMTHEMRHCFEGNFHKGRDSTEDC